MSISEPIQAHGRMQQISRPVWTGDYILAAQSSLINGWMKGKSQEAAFCDLLRKLRCSGSDEKFSDCFSWHLHMVHAPVWDHSPLALGMWSQQRKSFTSKYLHYSCLRFRQRTIATKVRHFQGRMVLARKPAVKSIVLHMIDCQPLRIIYVIRRKFYLPLATRMHVSQTNYVFFPLTTSLFNCGPSNNHK